jgi:hypothetical protein
MKNRDKIRVATSMTIDFDDFRDLVWSVCGDDYGVDDDYGQLRFIRTNREGEEIDDYDEDETERYVISKIDEYFDVITSGFYVVSEYGSHVVMIPYTDNALRGDGNA